jgi:phage baseplate assembly protein W
LLRDLDGAIYCITRVARNRHGSDLRWIRATPGSGDAAAVTLRAVVDALEAYEPAVVMSMEVLEAHSEGANSTLRREVTQVRSSRHVLNRRLREAVAAELERGTSLAQIAQRCGRTKTIAHGARTGDGAWVARRVGLIPDGKSLPTRWVDERVLAEIAEALGLTPADVRL